MAHHLHSHSIRQNPSRQVPLEIREPYLQLHSMDADKNLSNTDDAMNPV
jgi:hypothetical protein